MLPKKVEILRPGSTAAVKKFFAGEKRSDRTRGGGRKTAFLPPGGKKVSFESTAQRARLRKKSIVSERGKSARRAPSNPPRNRGGLRGCTLSTAWANRRPALIFLAPRRSPPGARGSFIQTVSTLRKLKKIGNLRGLPTFFTQFLIQGRQAKIAALYHGKVAG